jgi:MYXO-CTERM domain-containing protein
MRLVRCLPVVSFLFLPMAAFAQQPLDLDPGGPWHVREGEEIEIVPIVSGGVPPYSYAWDLDGPGGDGVFDDGDEDRVTFSAAGIDGPSDGFQIAVVVSDSANHQRIVQIEIDVTNVGPEFLNVHDPTATIGREWSWTPDVVDIGGDEWELEVDDDDMPVNMSFDPLTNTFTWTPTPAHLIGGDPPGHYEFRVTASDEDRGNTRYEVILDVVENIPPPAPGLAYPAPESLDPVLNRQPTLVMSNVEDPDGDVLSYFIEVDANQCFCSPEVLRSGPLEQGDLATQWHLSDPLIVEPGVEKTYYVRRWTSDGISESDRVLSLFKVIWAGPGGGDGDADADSDADSDADADGPLGDDDDTSGGDGGCACSVGAGAPSNMGLFATALMAGAVLVRRRRS